MPIVIDKDLPAYKVLTGENIFVMDEGRATKQDIRPVEIAVLNLMPTKETTETQLMRLLSNTPLQVNVTLLRTASYTPTHVGAGHLDKFYHDFEEVKSRKFDGMIITGAPVENMAFEQVAYWKELVEILDWTEKNVTSTLFICWAAQAALYHFYGVQKQPLKNKCFGVYSHSRTPSAVNEQLLRGFSDEFYMPHSRHTAVKREDIERVEQLEMLAVSKRAGAGIIKSRDGKKIFVTGHMEYDRETLQREYERDLGRGLDVPPPANYYKGGEIRMSWTSTASLFFVNWLNYYVYQVTPYIL